MAFDICLYSILPFYLLISLLPFTHFHTHITYTHMTHKYTQADHHSNWFGPMATKIAKFQTSDMYTLTS